MALEELQNGRYRRLRLLGRGGMGEVYLMDDTRVNRHVAIKIMRSEESANLDEEQSANATRLFQREARAIATLEHPNILPLYDFGEEEQDGNTVIYMVMPYCAEGSLAGWLKQRHGKAKMTLPEIAYLIDEATEGLQYAHDQQVVHLDVKPSNFLLRTNKKRPDQPTLLLADFGIARSFTTVSSSSHTIRGTPTSMAPEQWSSNPVAATDQYALAVMTYEILTGRPPFTGGMEQLMFQHFSSPVPAPSSFNPRLTDEIDMVLTRALEKKPEDRYPSITDFMDAFRVAAQVPLRNVVVDPQAFREANLHSLLADPDLDQMATFGAEAFPNTGETYNTQRGSEMTPSEGSLVLADERSVQTPDHTQPDEQTPDLTMPPRKKSETDKFERSRKAESVVLPSPSAPSRTAQAQASASDPTSEHNLPTLAITSPGTTLPPQSQRPRRTPGLRIMSIIIAALLLILLIGGTVVYINSRPNTTGKLPSNTASLSPTQTPATTAAPTNTPVSTPTAVPPGKYIGGTYNGSMTNQFTNQSSPISVFLSQKRGSGVLLGSVIVNGDSQHPQPLSGTVDKQGNFSFNVPHSGLLYTGQTQNKSDGTYLNGNYCSSKTDSCLSNTGYFSAGPGF